MTIKAKKCRACGVEYQPSGCAQKFCTLCRPAESKKTNRRATDAYRARNGVKVGIGSGNGQGRGKSHRSYKNGISRFKVFSTVARVAVRFCERCDKDLLEAQLGQWCVHHRDHDRENNVPSNWELLCKRCHQLEHDCAAQLPNALRIRWAKMIEGGAGAESQVEGQIV